jgi:hypothetical protein
MRRLARGLAGSETTVLPTVGRGAGVRVRSQGNPVVGMRWLVSRSATASLVSLNGVSAASELTRTPADQTVGPGVAGPRRTG